MTSRRWIAVLAAALFVSLAGNLFLGGAMLGRGLQGPPEAGIRLGMVRILKSLPDADREIVKSLLEPRRAGFRRQVAAFRDARRAAGDILRAEPFDAAAYAAAEAEARRQGAAIQDSLRALLAEAAPRLSPEGRAALAKATWR
jgi:uncharacterized membrane protein